MPTLAAVVIMDHHRLVGPFLHSFHVEMMKRGIRALQACNEVEPELRGLSAYERFEQLDKKRLLGHLLEKGWAAVLVIFPSSSGAEQSYKVRTEVLLLLSDGRQYEWEYDHWAYNAEEIARYVLALRNKNEN